MQCVRVALGLSRAPLRLRSDNILASTYLLARPSSLSPLSLSLSPLSFVLQ